MRRAKRGVSPCLLRLDAAANLHSLDLDLPTKCDDEFWDGLEPSKTFKQPEDRPSQADLLVCFVGLYRAVAPGIDLIVRFYPT